MNIKRSATALVVSTFLLLTIATTTFAQTTSPSPSPSTDPSASPSSSVSPSPSASPDSGAGGATKSAVLGETTSLGNTSNNKEIAKWAIAFGVGILAFLIGLKVARSKAEE